MEIIKLGVCIDNNDPLKAGRIRAILDSDRGRQDWHNWVNQTMQTIALNKGIRKTGNSVVQTDSTSSNSIIEVTAVDWTKDDPFLYTPFLPLYVNQAPQANEKVKLIFYEPGMERTNRDYIGPINSTPTKLDFQHYSDADYNYLSGNRVKAPKALNSDNNIIGVYADPEDISFYGRGDSDVIIRKNKILTRSGKFIKTNGQIKSNNKLTIHQVSYFNNYNEFDDATEIIKEINDAPLKYYIEYELLTESIPYSASAKVYKMITSTDSLKFNTDTDFNNFVDYGQPIIELISINNNLGFVASDINKLLNAMESGVVTPITTTNLIIKVNNINDPLKPSNNATLNYHPFYFKPSYNNLNSKSQIIKTFIKNIKNNGCIIQNGGGLSFSLTEKHPTPKQKEIKTKIGRPLVGGYGVNSTLTDKIYLLSHRSSIPGKNKIEIKELNKLLGFDEFDYGLNIDPNTEGLLRGDQTIILIKKIWEFMKNHVHPLCPTPPVNTAKGGQTADEIDTIITNADNSLINQNIRIN